VTVLVSESKRTAMEINRILFRVTIVLLASKKGLSKPERKRGTGEGKEFPLAAIPLFPSIKTN